jgi:hypothetical protein
MLSCNYWGISGGFALEAKNYNRYSLALLGEMG